MHLFEQCRYNQVNDDLIVGLIVKDVTWSIYGLLRQLLKL